MDLGKVGNKIANVGTLGAWDPLRKIASGNANEYRADETAYNQMLGASGDNNLALQNLLMEQIQGRGPNLGQQQFENASQQLARQAAGQIGGIKGISPAAAGRLVSQRQAEIGQNLAGESALQRMQQQMLAQQQLGQNSLGMYNTAVGGRLGAQNVNAAVTNSNTDAQGRLVGGIISGGASGVAAYAGKGKADGGYIEPESTGPQSNLGRALMAGSREPMVFMADGGVPGTAVVHGDSPANDLVPARLSPGEIVIPRSHAHSPEAAASFVEALQRRQVGGYEDVVRARQSYADGGEVEDEGEPGLFDRAKKWAEDLIASIQDDAVGVAANALPDALGGKFKKQIQDRKAKADATLLGGE
jgi:hypothetical protein